MQFFKLHSKTCGYLLIIHILLIIISTVRGEAMLFFQIAISSSVLFRPACYFEDNRLLPLLQFYTVYEIAV